MHLESAEAAGNRVLEVSDTFLAHREGVVVVIEVYMDESGTHEGSQVLTVSAVWAPKEIWSAWTYDWILAKAPISIFHAVDCHNRSGEFKGWARTKRDDYVRKQILPTIRNHYIRGVIAAVDKRQLAKRLKEKHGIAILSEDFIRGWYYICLRWAMRHVLDDIARGSDKLAALVHEENQYGVAALNAYADETAKGSDIETTFSIAKKITFPPLQCADVLAYEGNHQMRDFSQPLRKPLQAIDPLGKRFSFRKFDATEVDTIVDFSAQYLKRVASELAQG